MTYDPEAARLQLIEVRTKLDQAISLLAQQQEDEGHIAVADRKPLVWGAKVSADFRASVLWIEQKLGLKADYLMACMAFETGVTFSPSKRNPRSTATGLIQFMRATATGLGTTTEALAQMSAVKQLSYVYKYFQRFGNDLSHWDLADTYMAILLPVMIGKPLDTPMAWSAESYDVNKGLDTDHNRVVTKREAYERVHALYLLGSQPENVA